MTHLFNDTIGLVFASLIALQPAGTVLPSLPAGADTIEPVTLLVAVPPAGQASGAAATQTVLKTVDRMLVVLHGAGSEWLFERNPVDPRRASGYLIDHKRKMIVMHTESELRARLGLRGWADVLAMVPESGVRKRSRGVDSARLSDPRTRFPAYDAVDAADVGDRKH